MKITVENLSKRYNKKVLALNDVNLELNGGVLGLIGRNGAGKTTLMRILATAIKQTEGSVKFDDKDIFKHLKEYRSKLGYLPQTTSLMPTMNIYEFLAFPICLTKAICLPAKIPRQPFCAGAMTPSSSRRV
jgi:ABC-2 type transport system ATP-binding protein